MVGKEFDDVGRELSRRCFFTTAVAGMSFGIGDPGTSDSVPPRGSRIRACGADRNVRAARADRLQSSLNLAIGSALASIGLTVPVVVVASIAFDLPLVLGVEPKDMTMLAVTFLVSAVTLGTGRTYMMQGAVHLVLFAAFLFLAFVP